MIVFFNESEGWVAGPVLATVPGQGSDAFFFDLVAPGPLPFAGALVDPLVVSLHSGGSWWSLFGLLTGAACGGPPACIVGAVGAGPCGIFICWPWRTALSTPFSFVSWSIEDGVFYTAFLRWWLLLMLLGRQVVYLGWYEPSFSMFVHDGFIQVIWSITSRLVVALVEICCFSMCLWSSSFSCCRCWSSAFYTPVCRCLWILNIKCDGAYFV